jgi:DNA polymerase-3 subunit gamma/tau
MHCPALGVTPGCGPNIGTPSSPPSDGVEAPLVDPDDPELAVPELAPEAALEPADAPVPAAVPEPADAPDGVLDPDGLDVPEVACDPEGATEPLDGTTEPLEPPVKVLPVEEPLEV